MFFYLSSIIFFVISYKKMISSAHVYLGLDLIYVRVFKWVGE